MIETLKNRIQAISQLDNEAMEKFLGCLDIKEFPAKHLIFKEGKTAKYLYYIVNGAARAYYIKDGKEVVLWFAFEDDLITSVSSFISQKTSFENIELLENSTLAAISHKELNHLTKKYPSINQLYRTLLEQYYIILANQYREIHFFSAKEKYDNLLKSYPSILQRVSLGNIASYLGITQESLSRIRAGK
jgi:CRP-like cAMP-binding protein